MMKGAIALVFAMVGAAIANAQSVVHLGNLLGQGYQITAAQPLPTGGAIFFIVQKSDKAYYCALNIQNFGPLPLSNAPCVAIPSN